MYTLTNGFETDFIVQNNKGSIIDAIQGCRDLNENNLKRERQGLQKAMECFDLEKNRIVTFEQEYTIEAGFSIAALIPGWK